MADVSITAANIRGPAERHEVKLVQVTSGGSLDAGEWSYRLTDGSYQAAQNDQTAADANVRGFTLANGTAATSDFLPMATGGNIIPGGTLVKGRAYFLSSSGSGLMSPEVDIASTEYATLLGIATSTTAFDINIFASGNVAGGAASTGDVTVTVGNVRGPAGEQYVQRGTAGETVTRGAWLYLKASDSRLWLADSDASLEAATVVGMCLVPASAGEPVYYANGGRVNPGGTLVAGRGYVLSDTAGGLLMPEGDLASGDYCTFLGISNSTTLFDIHIVNSGITVT